MTETVIEVSVVAARETLWPALTEPALIRRWFGWDYDGLGDEITQIFSTATATPTTFTLEVSNGDTFTLVEGEGTTIVRITRPPEQSGDEWYNDITEGWITFLHFLKFGVEHHGLTERRTIYLDGPLHPGETAAAALRLSSVDAIPGTRYSATLPPGDFAEGVVDYVSGAQTGVTIEDLGPGLLSFATRPAGRNRTAPALHILLATYDLSDDEFNEIEYHWKQWWDGRTREE